MAVKPKLTYFNCRGSGEPIRYLLAYGNTDYEDIRFEDEEFPKLKPNFPYGQVPVLEINGKMIPQTLAICRYLAKRNGLYGSDDFEAMQIDAVADAIVDLRNAFTFCYWITPEDQRPAHEEKLKKQTLPFYLSRFEKSLQENNGYFVNGKLSYADIFFAGQVQHFSDNTKYDITDGYPQLKALVEKLTYFNYRGSAEPIRYLLAYGNIEYEDCRFADEEFPKLKPNFPYGQVPVLEIKGKMIPQTLAICRYLAKQSGLYGKDDFEAMQIDAVSDAIIDLRNAVWLAYWITPEDERAPLVEKLTKKTLPFYLSRFEKTIQENNGYFVNGNISYADIVLAGQLESLSDSTKYDITDGYPLIKALVKKVENLPRIKAWIEKRPKTIVSTGICYGIVMASKPKLTYLNIRGFAEPIRYLLAYANIEYEDRRINPVDFPQEKLSLPYGQVPVLEINGKVINQSNAITRFVASLCGLTGSDDFEAFQIHAMADTIMDLRNFFGDSFWRPIEQDEEHVQARKQEHLRNDIIPFYLSRFEKTVKENNGYFVNGKLSYADVMFAALELHFSNCLEEDITSSYPVLKELVEKGPVLEINGKTINQSNAIARYIAKLGGLTGSDDFEELQIHAFVDTINDFRDAIVDCYWGPSNEDQSKKEEKLKKEILPFYLKRFEKALKNHNGYFVNGKVTLPFGLLPVLEINGKVINQSTAICRYFAKRAGLAGGDEFEALQIDAVADSIVDLRNAFVNYFWRTPEAQKPSTYETLKKENIPVYLSQFEKILKENNGHFVNGKLSYADLLFAGTVEYFNNIIKFDMTEGYPLVKALVEKVHNIPRIKAWIARRPQTFL
ncbi:Glutathione S-transferase [Gryllus bimaculatus]|nr:Glutathione S-transferase [Gryllus bimaculatus]